MIRSWILAMGLSLFAIGRAVSGAQILEIEALPIESAPALSGISFVYTPSPSEENAVESIELRGLPETELEVLREKSASKDASSSSKDCFAVYTQLPSGDSLPPVMGSFEVDDEAVRFSPRFPFQAGLSYYIGLDRNKMISQSVDQFASVAYYRFALPKPKRVPTAIVSQIFPSASELPANLLKFYLHFSHPMSLGDSYVHIRLLDEKGKAVALPFLELGEELWDSEGKRLTLLFDPGRIKSGLKPRMEEGSILKENQTYTLVVSNSWQDAEGQPLKMGYRKTFSVMEPDIESPRVDNWRLSAPPARSKSALSLEFPEALDEALLGRVLLVLDSNDRIIDGFALIDGGEKRWSFAPSNPWSEGVYRVRVETILEDVAGNSLGRPFEVEIRKEERHLRPERYAYLDFAID